jgi:purine-binding chemotaxis protein CheW
VTDAAFSEDARVKLAVFRVGTAVYALDIAHVREIVRWQTITPLPVAPQLIEGVIDLRGAVVPVVDLARALGSGAVAASATARIAIVEADGLVMGLAVDAALEVMSADVAVLEDPPALATQAGYDAVRAVVRRPDSAPALVLSLEHILESVYRSALRPQTPRSKGLQEDAA